MVILIMVAGGFSSVCGAGELKVEGAWVRGVPGTVSDTAAFMKLVNTGDEVLRVTGGTADFAGMVMPMETTRKVVNGVEVVGMKGLDFLEVPAHGALVLEPGGDHLMLMNLKTHPGIGDKVKLTLQVEPGHRTVTIEAEVKLDAD